jgi:diguanylate cyclase (GGDEF)-like protein
VRGGGPVSEPVLGVGVAAPAIRLRRLRSAPRAWAMTALPGATVVVVVCVTVLALVSVVLAAASAPLRGGDLVLFVSLLGAAVASLEAVRRVPEPVGNANDMLAAWCVPIAVLLPPVYSFVAAAVLMACTQWRVSRIAVYKRVYSAAAIGLAHAAASALFHGLPEAWRDWEQLAENPARLTVAAFAAAILAKLLNACLIGMAVKTADLEASWRGVLVVDNGRLESTEVSAGVLVAVCVGLSPLLALVALPPVLLLQRGMLYAQLHAAARTDLKTGLLNAMTWEREAAAALSAARRADRSASVLLVDIDHFKRVNDTHGHLVGDDVLRSIADVLRRQFRDEQDLLCRFGGEEFAVFLPGLDTTEAPKAADRLRRAVAEAVTPADASLVQVTVSVGVAVADPRERDTDVHELLARADLGLYRAKGEGRNKVRLMTRPDRRAPSVGLEPAARRCRAARARRDRCRSRAYAPGDVHDQRARVGATYPTKVTRRSPS